MREIFTLIALSALLISCSGGGGGDGGGGGSAASTTTVSGSVQAPNGQIVFNHSTGFLKQLASLFTPSAYASISGQTPVPDGTLVQLARLNATGSDVSILSTTTTAGGRYSFNLTHLGIQFSNDLIVQVPGPTGKVIRAFVTNTTVDLDPGSELAVRLVLEQLAAIPGATLSQFTLKEVNDIATSLRVLTTVKQFTGGANLEMTISTLRNTVVADPNLMAFIAAAATDGQTTLGPGDVGNYFPFTQGNAWNFQGTRTETGHPTISYQNTLTITGTTLIGGINATVRSESNSDGLGTSIDDYVMKDTAGITNHGNNDSTDLITPHVTPFQELQFPLQAGASFQAVNKRGLDYGQDLDGDGRNETFDVTARVTVVDFETVVVSAGSFQNAAQTKSELTVTVVLSKNGSMVMVAGSATIWLAPGIGPIKQQTEIQSQGVRDTTSEELVSYVVN